MIKEMTFRNRSRRQLIILITISIMTAFVLMALTSCSVMKLIEDGEQDAAVANVDEAKLNCSEECMDRGQCGVDDNGDQYILLDSSMPSLKDHDKAYKSDTRVDILDRENHSIMQPVDGKTFDMSFYQVSLPQGDQAWVAGWCLEN